MSKSPLPLPMLSPAPLGSSAWLLYLRWSAVVGQLLTVLAAGLLTSVELPYAPLFACVVLTAITNLAYGAWLKFQTGKQQSQQSEDKNTPFVQSNDSGTNSEN